MRKCTLSLTVQDSPGVLQRIAGLFGRRGYNMDSITVGASEEEGTARVTIIVREDERSTEQICRQLRKLIDVLEVKELGPSSGVIGRELLLVKLRAAPEQRPEILAMAEAFRCSVVDAGPNSLVLQSTGETEKNDAFLRLAGAYGILEVARTGETAMSRGEKEDVRRLSS
ncbi:acetolactate synthase, small subunit [Paenibacillus mucilaginosus 3016]|uniref:Acetolactate synthase small subunit n=2 Tax=Paenibacillus mucilaginosus TaxID=61624 RepID=H6N9F2_9BACL|nr:acetolactate synthase small subunit [Paenibacillus mucilaginosus]AFC27958.1 acetolactate synthase, small subunit [Paenibacillus mucilaginosus 3016]AFH60113.1 acetolactate synthase [Paenibacillus mucilaginosus K02]WFA16814.1 acetolactate synthase small subunit [Paenibacillus mucilaginosus]